MEELERIWKKQLDFHENFIKSDSTSEQKQAHTKELILHLISECDEVLREINWKMHRSKEISNINRKRLTEEIVDVIKYGFSLAQTWGVTASEFKSEFYRKSEVVEQRYKQEMLLNLIQDKEVICVDIDGVLGKYPEAFIKFISERTGVDLSSFNFNKYNLYDMLADLIPGGIDKMKELKHEFRDSGKECYLPVFEDGAKALRQFKASGATIVLLTARPYKQYPRFFADTIDWLKTNNIPYDAIMWDEHKEERIIKEFPLTKFLVEDNTDNANKVADKGYKVYLLNRSYNKEYTTRNSVIRVNDWSEIVKHEGI